MIKFQIKFNFKLQYYNAINILKYYKKFYCEKYYFNEEFETCLSGASVFSNSYFLCNIYV